jgi:hypothetical protein
MKKYYYLTYFLFFMFNVSFGQNPPLPPDPPKYSSKALIYGDPNGNYSKRETKKTDKKVEILESSTEEIIPTNSIKTIPKFNISINESTNANSIYYFKNIELQIAKLDTLISDEQIISLTKYQIHASIINPTYLDSLAKKVYKLNEEKSYTEAIELAKLILVQCPNNITAHKEMSYSYKHIDNEKLSNLHFSMMVKIIKAVFKYGDGSRINPYILNNFFEGLSIYEAKFGCFPKKVRLILTTEKKLLGGYDCYHIMRFSNLTHWLPLLKVEDYKIEE